MDMAAKEEINPENLPPTERAAVQSANSCMTNAERRTRLERRWSMFYSDSY